MVSRTPPGRIQQVFLISVLLTAVIGTIPSNALGGIGGKFGLQVQATTNKFTGELPEEGSWVSGFGPGVGLVAEVDLLSDVALSLQPTFLSRNSRREFNRFNTVVDYVDYELDYLTLPLIVRVAGTSQGTRGFVTGGLELGILLDATATGTQTGTQDIKDNLNSTTLGALFGAGVMVPVSRNFLIFEVRYFQGLEDIVNRDGKESDADFTSPSVKYRGLGLIVGFLFGLGDR